MEKHKNKALEKDCLCSKCIFRFQCFTQERIFSDPIYQGLFEALMAQGKSKEEALDEVTNEIKFRMIRDSDRTSYDPNIGIPYDPNITIIPTVQPWVQPWGSGDYSNSSDSVTIDANDNGEMRVSYTMWNGEEVSWLCK